MALASQKQGETESAIFQLPNGQTVSLFFPSSKAESKERKKEKGLKGCEMANYCTTV
jgi:hypothetical protein